MWGFASGLIFTSIWVLYYTVMELSLVQVSLLFVVLTVTSLVFEIPTGILADVYSRRLSVILGGGLMGCCLRSRRILSDLRYCFTGWFY